MVAPEVHITGVVVPRLGGVACNVNHHAVAVLIAAGAAHGGGHDAEVRPRKWDAVLRGGKVDLDCHDVLL